MAHTNTTKSLSYQQEMNERALIERVKADDEDAFVALYNNYKKKLRAYALVITDSSYLADEMVQEAFIKVWRIRKNLDSELNFKHYLFKITKNLAFDHLKKVARDKKLKAEQSKNIQNAHYSTEQALTFKEYLDLVDKVIQQLPTQKKIVYDLSRRQGKSNQEIANQLGLSIFTVKNHLGYALNAVKAKLRVAAEITLPFLPVMLFF